MRFFCLCLVGGLDIHYKTQAEEDRPIHRSIGRAEKISVFFKDALMELGSHAYLRTKLSAELS
ncbi:MAG: hypothetical protein LBJ43_04085, partial [Propionibacteriaceae bacterium]|nr:hypothetical protein [Propionibacteriaceae bacterium]